MIRKLWVFSALPNKVFVILKRALHPAIILYLKIHVWL